MLWGCDSATESGAKSHHPIWVFFAFNRLSLSVSFSFKCSGSSSIGKERIGHDNIVCDRNIGLYLINVLLTLLIL